MFGSQADGLIASIVIEHGVESVGEGVLVGVDEIVLVGVTVGVIVLVGVHVGCGVNVGVTLTSGDGTGINPDVDVGVGLGVGVISITWSQVTFIRILTEILITSEGCRGLSHKLLITILPLS